MTKYSGSGWHRQSIRHSNARKYGKAGGKYKNQYELTTTKNQMDMPYPLFANNKIEAKKYAESKLRKGEKIISIERSYNPSKKRRKAIMKEFEDMTEMAELKALSKTSLERPLTNNEYERMMLLGKKQIGYETTKKHYGNPNLHYIPAPKLESANDLPVQVSLLVPSTENRENIKGEMKTYKITAKQFNKRVNETKKFFDELKDPQGNYGGDTTIKDVGSYWDGEKKKLIHEKGAIVERSMSIPTYKKIIDNITRYAEKKQKDYKQSTMLIAVEGRKFIVPKQGYIDDDKITQNKPIPVS